MMFCRSWRSRRGGSSDDDVTRLEIYRDGESSGQLENTEILNRSQKLKAFSAEIRD